MVALLLVSGVLYLLHAVMAWKVKNALEDRERRIEAGVEMVNQEEIERRHSEARERWKHISAG